MKKNMLKSMNFRRRNFMTQFMVFTAFFCLATGLWQCTEEQAEAPVTDGETTTDDEFTPDDWTEYTHAKLATPIFEEVFDDDSFKRLDIVIGSDRWQAMLNDLTSKYGSSGSSQQGPGQGGPGQGTTDDPIWEPADIFYHGTQWYRVGVRFKGNSSLMSTWRSGNMKLSFKLDFDQYEDDYPQIENQRFFGFKKLSLKNNYDDKSCLREKVAAEVFADAGLAVSHTAFYRVYVDYGDGPVYFGVYTLVEEVDDTVKKTQFDKGGNLYKPEDTGASFREGTFSESDFEKKTNEDEADWTDITTLFAVLHDSRRTSSPAAWRATLDSVFDTQVFLKYLAVNTVIQNWDTYGTMPHNYFLYNNPANGKLTWIPWDNNEAFQSGKMGGALALDFSNLQSGQWPLIEYLYADSVYRSMYDQYVKETVDRPFDVTTIQEKYVRYASLIGDFVRAENSGYTFLQNTSDFDAAVASLKSQVQSRADAVSQYLP